MANPRMTAEIGRVLGGRYRLVAPIGLGASAQVYLADDVRLRRRVALKMLHDALAGDVEFLRRFRAEARAAAALSHPNVMAVYDWGDDGTAFIVTEYLGGGSLRALLDRGELLSPSQALGLGLEATRALDYAHRRGFVHRDIKPANLLFGEEQRLRIADFGLARALAEAAWTEPQGAMLGTARYASPEQAKGEQLSGKADVYSLALVLIEAVTGVVPFTADTTLGTLMARVGKHLDVPEELGPLRDVLARAAHPDPAERIDARALATGLLRAAKALPKPAALPLAGALPPAGEVVADADPTVHAPLVVGSVQEIDLTEDDLDLDPPDWVNQSEPVGTGVGVADDATAAGADGGPEGAAVALPVDLDADAVGTIEAVDEPDAVDPDAAPGEIDADADADADVDVDADADDPDPVAGDPAAEVSADPAMTGDEDGPGGDGAVDPEPSLIDLRDLAAVGAGPAWADDTDPARVLEPVDRVVDPTATVDRTGSRMAGGATTVIARPTASADRPAVPAYRPPDAADPAPVPAAEGERRRRRRWPWVLLVLVLVAGGGGAAAATIARDEPEAPVRTVTLPVPSLVGLTDAEATQVAEAAGWNVTIASERRDDTVKGQVLASVPTAGARLKPDGALRLTVSEGQTIKPVPQDLAGRTLDDATQALFFAGFAVDGSQRAYDEEVADGSVIALVEGTPTELEKGSLVAVVVSQGPEPRTVPSGLQGSTEAAAKDLIASLQLKAAVNRQPNETVTEGEVVSVSPRPGTEIARGGTVTIEVSSGPPTVAVPSVTAADGPREAAAILRAAGLVPGDTSGPSEGTPVRTSPAAGSTVRRGSTVDIILG